MEIVLKYFPDLSSDQIEKFKKLQTLYDYWNNQINVISRKDIDELYERHILHSLAIAKYIKFRPGTEVLDIGTGGGFPGIPLAILYPETNFYLVDSIGKKIKVVNEISESLGLNNVQAEHARAEKINRKFDFIVSRAVTNLSSFKHWVKGKIKKEQINRINNGVIYLKGGDLTKEIKESGLKCKLTPLSEYFEEEFFSTKCIVYWKNKSN
ncbi:MAG: 16S rRNA (guanine527-N7)-methyltransferase [Glaciecola sp.]